MDGIGNGANLSWLHSQTQRKSRALMGDGLGMGTNL